MAGPLAARVKANAGHVVALVFVVAVFAFVLPRVADYGDVWDALANLGTGGTAGLLVVALINLATFAPPWMAALPGLSMTHALVMSQASTAAAAVLPGGDAVGMGISYAMLRRWGFSVQRVAVATAATATWNAFANVMFAVAAAVFLAMSGESHALLTTAAVIGTAAVVVAITLFAVALHDDGKARVIGGLSQRLWNRIARVLRRRAAYGWEERLPPSRRGGPGALRAAPFPATNRPPRRAPRSCAPAATAARASGATPRGRSRGGRR